MRKEPFFSFLNPFNVESKSINDLRTAGLTNLKSKKGRNREKESGRVKIFHRVFCVVVAATASGTTRRVQVTSSTGL